MAFKHGPDERGLGGQQSPYDARDKQIAELYGSLDMAAASVLPARHIVTIMPPVFNQGDTPRCVTYASAAMKGSQDLLDWGSNFSWDFPRFATEIGTTSAGAFARTAMDHMLHTGYPVVGVASEADHKIAAYYAVPLDVTAMKQAIIDFGVVSLLGPWPHSWFHPVSGVLPTPDYSVGGHDLDARGFDDAVAGGSFRLRNSWGTAYGLSGDVWMPYRYLAGRWEAWKSTDVLSFTKRTVKCAGGVYRKGPGTNYATVKAMAAGQVASCYSGAGTPGGAWTLTCGTKKTGTGWYKIRAINGQSVSALFGVPVVYAATGWF